MPDFAKALRALNPGAPAAFSPRSLIQQLQFLKPRVKPVSNVLPDGEVRSNSLGSHYFIHAVYPEDHYHGKVRLSRFSGSDLECVVKAVREKAQVPDRDRIVFLDTETTGMQGGTGTCPFLVGIGYFAGADFHMVQYFIRDFDEEPSMLLALGNHLRQFEMIVTYNGAAFDLPLLETRFTLSRLDHPLQSMSHFDLLFTARKLWRNGHGSCRLVALERELLSFLRGPDVPGALIPRTYFDYLQDRPTPALESVFTHNVHDVISLAALTVHACDRITLEPAALDEPLDLYSLGRLLENSADWRPAIRLYQMSLDGGLPEPTRRKALEGLAVAYRRAGEHELALQVAEQLIRYPEFSMVGYESAVIFHERVAKNLDAALQVLTEALSRVESGRCRSLLESRWDRLQQKRLEI